jgi:hypothetical protein
MCDHTLVEKMKQYQAGPGSLECNPGPNCWCAQISYRFPLAQFDECMTPKEMLDVGGDDLTEDDQRYLKSLLKREVVF